MTETKMIKIYAKNGSELEIKESQKAVWISMGWTTKKPTPQKEKEE